MASGAGICTRTLATKSVGDTRVSSVQYLKFEVGAEAPLAIGCDHPDPELRHETVLTAEQRAALPHDLDE